MTKMLLPIVLVLAGVSFLTVSCSRFVRSGKGTLTLRVAGTPIAPELRAAASGGKATRDAASFRVHCDGPVSATYDTGYVPVNTRVQTSLTPGEWLVTVDAFDREEPSELIGSGQVAVTIQSGGVTSATVPLGAPRGYGGLQLTVDWPGGSLKDPHIKSVLHPALNSGRAVVAVSEVTGPRATSTFVDVPVGYYALQIFLSDGSARVWGTVEAARVIRGKITTGSITLVRGDGTGNLILSADVSAGPMVRISLTGVRPYVPDSATSTFMATPSGGGTYRYAWYLDGSILRAASGPFLTVGPHLGAAPHTLSVLARSGSTLSSAQVGFTVTRSPATAAAIARSGSRAED